MLLLVREHSHKILAVPVVQGFPYSRATTACSSWNYKLSKQAVKMIIYIWGSTNTYYAHTHTVVNKISLLGYSSRVYSPNNTYLHVNIQYTYFSLSLHICYCFFTAGGGAGWIAWSLLCSAHLVPYMLPENTACSIKSPLSILACILSLVVKWYSVDILECVLHLCTILTPSIYFSWSWFTSSI